MKIRMTLSALLVLAASAYAQGPGRQGHMGFAGPRFVGAEPGMPGRVVKNAPYSADIVTETTQTLTDGNHIRQSTSAKVYRDLDGRTRREQSVNLNGLAANGTLPQLVFINDPVAGVNYVLNAKDHTATRFTAAPRGGQPGTSRPGAPGREAAGAGNGPRSRMGRGNQNIVTESLGKQMIEGVQAEGTRTTMTIPAGKMGNEQPIVIVNETWYSPELHTAVLSRRIDPRMGDSVTKLMNISRSEPPRLLFEAPADYKVTETGRMGRPAPNGGTAQQ